MEPGVILAKSERQAMDWSLVLISQGIENTIEHSVETAQWQLIVSQPEYQRAIKAIKQYHIENKRGVWVQELPWSDLLLDWRAAAWALILIAIFFANHVRGGAWEEVGLMNNALVAKGEWWRLFTATMLHADLGHLAVNVTMGVVLVGLAMGAYGPGVGLLGSYLAGVGGNLAGFLVYGSKHQSLGASGVVMGALGVLTIQSIGRGRGRELLVRAVGGGFLLLVLLGLSPDPRTDVLAHAGGFASGLILGAPLATWRKRGFSVDVVALAIFSCLVILTWWLALR
jgi:membrane associated rhomboid family serine protease